MGVFIKAMAGGFVGKLVATIFIAVCVAFSFGPELWVQFILQGSAHLTASNARGLFFALGLAAMLLLLFSIFKSPPSAKLLTAEQLEYALNITGLSLYSDKKGKRKRNIQIGVNLENTSRHAIRYEMDSIFVSIAGAVVSDSEFLSTGLILRSGATDVFRSATFNDLSLDPESQVVVSMNISYGQPGQVAVRHLKREYKAILRVTATTQNLTWTIGEDWDTPL